MNKQFQVVAKEVGVGLLKCGMISKYYLYMNMAIEKSSAENVLIFTLLVILDHDDEHLVEDFEHLCISGQVTYNDEV